MPETKHIVYVGTMEYPFRSMIMSHMACEDIPTLHAMAERLGLKRWYFQDHKPFPHYDISKGKKALAITYGAELVNDRELIRKCYPQVKGTILDIDK